LFIMSEQKILISFEEYQKLKSIEKKYHESLGKVFYFIMSR